MRVADSVRKYGRLLTEAQTLKEMLTVAQILREIADCGTDHEGD